MDMDWNKKEDHARFWHSSSHLLATAVKELFPGALTAIGPAIEEGFYYDFFVERPFTSADLEKIEKKMLEIATKKQKFEKKTVSKAEALKLFKDNKFKTELINELEEKNVTLYSNGSFTDLCKGPHIENSGEIKAIKLLKTSAAYWRGDEKKQALQRIYGISFPKQEMLDEWLKMRELAEQRSHIKIGKEQELFLISEEVGSGLVLWAPKGFDLREQLILFLRKEQIKRGYKFVATPHIGKMGLYKKSGHWEHYNQMMYSPIKVEGEEYILKPTNCPHHIKIYEMKRHSYRDLPLRLAEFGTVYRYEKSGELNGLVRVRGFTQDDSHIFCTLEQLKSEFENVIDVVLYIFKVLGFSQYRARLGTRDNSEKFMGTKENWERAQKDIEAAAKERKIPYEIAEGEAAFYGPKLDFLVKDALGREWQLGTIQVDYNLPERFDLYYIGADDKKSRPVMIHRAPFGSLERFIGILIEHFAGAFPLWLSPVQVKILTIADRHENYANELAKKMLEKEIRVEVDNRKETLPAKVRDAQLEKTNYILVVGDKEEKNNSVTVRTRKGKVTGDIKAEAFIGQILKEIEEKKIE